jgi:hypothetical protein
MATSATSASAYWSPAADSHGDGASSAATITTGGTPVATASGGSVSLSWPASSVAGGQPVSGYRVKRFEATTLAAQSIQSGCDNIVQATYCTELAVPNGSWRYSVTPVMGTFWTGPESLKSNTVTTNSVASRNSISVNPVSGNAASVGDVVYYRGVDPGSFTLTNAVTSASATPASSSTAALGGTTTGWSHTASTVSSPSGGPYVSNPFSWTGGTTSSPTLDVTGRDSSGGSAVTSLTYVNDSTPPSGSTVGYDDGYQPYQAVEVTFAAGSDSGVGIATHQLQRAGAPIDSGACGTFTSFANIGSGSARSPYIDSAVANQSCYVYRYVVTDFLGNQAVAVTGNVAKVDTSAGGPALGVATSFSVLGGTGVTSTGYTVVSGDLGVSPSTSIVGFPPGIVGGVQHPGDSTAAAAQLARASAYNDAAARTPTGSISGDIGGLTLTAGTYRSAAAVTLTGTVTLDGQGDPNALFVFQLGAAFASAAASHVTLVGGATASHVFWQVNGAAGTGASSYMVGSILAAGAITLGAGAQLLGRALAYGAVTLSTNSLSFSPINPPTVTITGGDSVDTWDTTPTIAGTTTASEGVTLNLTVGGQTLPATVQEGGGWSVTTAALPAGTYTALAAVRNLSGDAGTASQTITVEVNPTPPVLGAAGSFSVLAGTGLTSSGLTAVSGDLGVSPASSVVGFPPGKVGGTIHAGDATAASAQSALVDAYNSVEAQPASDSFSGEIGGLTFHEGIHHSAAAISLTGTVTLDARGDPNAVFIFQVNAALSTAAASRVSLVNGASPANVFWQVNGAFGAGASAFFAGTIMASGAITLGADVQLLGRALSYGAVTLSSNPIRFTTAPAPTVTIDGGPSATAKSATPVISGTTDVGVGMAVTVRVAEQVLTATVGSDGSWTVTAAALSDGPHDVVASVRDAAGNAANVTQTLTV